MNDSLNNSTIPPQPGEDEEIEDGPSDLVQRLLREMEDSGQSEALGVADCLSTIAANGGEQATDDHLLGCAEAMREWLEYFILQLGGQGEASGLLEMAERLEVTVQDLTSVVNTLKSNEAAKINDGGLLAQITYIIQSCGVDGARLQIAGDESEINP